MDNPWGEIILGGLAALGTWSSLGPEGKRKAIEILEAAPAGSIAVPGGPATA